MALKPTEVKAVAALLDEPADDAEELAKAIIRKLDELRSERTTFVLITQPTVGFTSAWGPFATEGAATRAWTKLHSEVGDVLGNRCMITPLRSAPRDCEMDGLLLPSNIVVFPSRDGARTAPLQRTPTSNAQPGVADVIYPDRIGGR